MTTIIEKPTMMSIAMVRPSVNRLNGEPKPGVPSAKIAPKIAIRTMQAEFVGQQQPGRRSAAAGASALSAARVAFEVIEDSFIASRRACREDLPPVGAVVAAQRRCRRDGRRRSLFSAAQALAAGLSPQVASGAEDRRITSSVR